MTGIPLITRLLVANRGEIARRIFRTCRRAGIGCVAVFSDPDAGAPHVAEADAAVRLPGSSPADTYLNAQAIVAAALAAGADAYVPKPDVDALIETVHKILSQRECAAAN